ncbi:DUF6243 family protein [Streptomyces qinglanensis]|uniref:Uncharacterized protein n=1 Tax=Streptomyces qinglanensis TaxID=943816 RepID=A0A1H9NRP4_9ACTN|nr:DUF6243 family protein [Streptomyces qinglanensis]SER38427.1 hypothetical protein SAMN05421870_101598 [Streptomyces qinglanensis]
MSKGRGGRMLGVGGVRSHLSRSRLRGSGGGPGAPAGGNDPQARKRELLRRLRESRM